MKFPGTLGVSVVALLSLSLAGCAMAGAATNASTIHHVRSAAEPVQSPATLAALANVNAPGRNLYKLTDWLRLRPPRSIPRIARTHAPTLPIGHQDTFWVLGEDQIKYFQVKATIRAETAHAYFYVENGVKYDPAALQRSANTFEDHTYPTDRAFYGSEWRPGVDGDVHLTILLADLRSVFVAGFFSAEDEYTRLVNPESNVREMFYMNTNTKPGGGDFDDDLAHEFQHMIHFHVHPRDDAWTNEGMSMLAQRINGYPNSVLPEVDTYLQAPGTQLDTWGTGDNFSHYGAAYLWFAYLYQRFGRPVIHSIVADRTLTDMPLMAAALKQNHIAESVDQVFGDWIVANYIDDASIGDGRYAYTDLPDKVAKGQKLAEPGTVTLHPPPYSAHYVDVTVPTHSFRLSVQGAPTVPLIGAPGSTPFWWGNRGDLMMTELTRSVDLRHVHRAHLHFGAWWNIEKSYDYGYVEVSTDGGKTWRTLPATSTTHANPNDANYGYGFTGTSHGWRKQTVDLSRYAGKKIDLRFQYITDDETNLQGFAVHDITIPEIGLKATLTGWQTKGFIPVEHNALPDQWYVRLIEHTSHGTIVRSLPVDAGGRGATTIRPNKGGITGLTVAIYSAAPKTTVSAPFTLTVSP